MTRRKQLHYLIMKQNSGPAVHVTTPQAVHHHHNHDHHHHNHHRHRHRRHLLKFMPRSKIRVGSSQP
ncbi:hypothetical protein E2C01_066044 [Portunus trituberculatus]|uniref:Uncharacterized protein n=1 Tax=Portunus trituberculatus TaxID=210409 RepID=A0A5B7HSU1_PORTR|nr:hypothetical protein [Portunus trituberculatus]